ncbi:MAG: hypothetical protein JXR03_17755 [Cyclobacteriaceae bacterium]
MEKLYKIAIGVFVVLAVVCFWFSIRSSTDQMEYAIAALILWGFSMLFNHLLKKEKRKAESENE